MAFPRKLTVAQMEALGSNIKDEQVAQVWRSLEEIKDPKDWPPKLQALYDAAAEKLEGIKDPQYEAGSYFKFMEVEPKVQKFNEKFSQEKMQFLALFMVFVGATVAAFGVAVSLTISSFFAVVLKICLEVNQMSSIQLGIF